MNPPFAETIDPTHATVSAVGAQRAKGDAP